MIKKIKELIKKRKELKKLTPEQRKCKHYFEWQERIDEYRGHVVKPIYYRCVKCGYIQKKDVIYLPNDFI